MRTEHLQKRSLLVQRDPSRDLLADISLILSSLVFSTARRRDRVASSRFNRSNAMVTPYAVNTVWLMPDDRFEHPRLVASSCSSRDARNDPDAARASSC